MSSRAPQLVWGLALALLLCALPSACSGGDAPTASEPVATRAATETPTAQTPTAQTSTAQTSERPAVADTEAWRRVATLAQIGVARTDERLAELPPEARRSVEGLLGRMEAFGRGPEALRQAGALAEAEAGCGNDPAWAGSGTPPGTRAVHAGALAVLEGMTVESMQQAPGDAQALVDAICAMPMPVYFNSGGRTDDTEERRTLVRAVMAGVPEGATPPERPSACGSPDL